MELSFPRAFQFLFRPARYKVAYGGRGSGKSWAFARALILRAAQERTRVLCVREFQGSIQESVHKLLSDQIQAMGLQGHFEIQRDTIRGANGSEFIFAGIRSNPQKIKSTEGADLCWCEEAETITDESWQTLIPTIRKPGSEIWISFNPRQEQDPTYQRFVLNPPPGAEVHKVTFADNPWFPEVLTVEMDHMRRVDYDAYLHVWEGHCLAVSQAAVLAGKIAVEDFQPPAHMVIDDGERVHGNPLYDAWLACRWRQPGPAADLELHGPYYGADWGFADDPSALIKCWIRDNTLYVEQEAYGHRVDIHRLPQLFDEIVGAREHVIRADCARPETISYMRQNGFPRIVACEKWKGSVEDGVARLRAFNRIVLHPRCKHAAEEARLWSFKVDRLSGDILPDLVDKHNHVWDAIRYALEPIIRKRTVRIIPHCLSAMAR